MKKKSESTSHFAVTPALLLARAVIRTGFRHKDRGMVNNGQSLFRSALRTINKQQSKCEQPELPFDDGPAMGS